MLFGKVKGNLMAIVHLHIYRKFDKIIVCSNFIADKIKASQLPISVIYTGVPSDYFVPLSDVERLNKRAELNISNKIKVWLFIGNLIPRKNPLFLISAFKKMKLKDNTDKILYYFLFFLLFYLYFFEVLYLSLQYFLAY